MDRHRHEAMVEQVVNEDGYPIWYAIDGPHAGGIHDNDECSCGGEIVPLYRLVPFTIHDMSINKDPRLGTWDVDCACGWDRSGYAFQSTAVADWELHSQEEQ